MNELTNLFKQDGRAFDQVPRFRQSVSEGMGVAFLHSRDNPFGNPYQVWKLYMDSGADLIKERLYGVAFRQMGARFRKFNRAVHVVPDDQIPTQGVRRHVVDPSKGRNYAQVWFLQTKDDRHYLYHEWPNRHEYIEGVGVMEPWAEPDGKKLDGKPGGGADPLGWGLLDYMDYWAKVEGWPSDWEERVAFFRGEEEEMPKQNKVQRLVAQQGVQAESVDEGSDIRIAQRIIDSRAASEGKVQQESMRYTTLQSEFSELGVEFDLAPGKQIDTGVNLIVDKLSFNPSEPVTFENSPDFYVSESCFNTIFSMETWTGEDGNKGACKDFIDLIRYYFESKPEYDESLETWEGANRRGFRAGSPY